MHLQLYAGLRPEFRIISYGLLFYYALHGFSIVHQHFYTRLASLVPESIRILRFIRTFYIASRLSVPVRSLHGRTTNSAV